MKLSPTNRRKLIALFLIASCSPRLHLRLRGAPAVEKGSGSKHCDEKEPADNVEVADDTLNLNKITASEQCCDPTSGMTSAPIRNAGDLVHALSAFLTAQCMSPELSSSGRQVSATIPVYRPPPKDYRIDRKMNCVLRI